MMLTFYANMLESLKNIQNFADDKYHTLKMLVLNDTFVQASYYDYYYHKKVVLRDNTTFAKVVFLLFVKYSLGMSVRTFVSFQTLYTPSNSLREWGVIELVYYLDRKEYRFYTKETPLHKGKLMEQIFAPAHKTFLLATISDRCEVTQFINDHLTSFNETNRLTFYDVHHILKLNKVPVPPNWDDKAYMKVIDDDSLEEEVFTGNEVIVFT